jgi:PBP1b-binding outer membrane lipoprotein LpoB
MKKLTAMLLTLCFTLMIVGCSEDTKAPKKDGAAKPAATDTPKKDK